MKWAFLWDGPRDDVQVMPIPSALLAPLVQLKLKQSAATAPGGGLGLEKIDYRPAVDISGHRGGYSLPRPTPRSMGDAQFLLDVGHHRVRQACLAEFREVLSDDVLP
jgi:hypothetical protein